MTQATGIADEMPLKIGEDVFWDAKSGGHQKRRRRSRRRNRRRSKRRNRRRSKRRNRRRR